MTWEYFFIVVFRIVFLKQHQNEQYDKNKNIKNVMLFYESWRVVVVDSFGVSESFEDGIT